MQLETKRSFACRLNCNERSELLTAKGLEPVSRKSRERFGPFVKVRPAYSVKLVFSYVVMGIKIKIIAESRASRSLRFEDIKIIMSSEMRL